jgi:hypothetical protein
MCLAYNACKFYKKARVSPLKFEQFWCDKSRNLNFVVKIYVLSSQLMFLAIAVKILCYLSLRG